MGSKSHASAVLFLTLNLLFFSLVTATSCDFSTPPPPKHKTTPSPKPTPPPKIKTPPSPMPTPPASTPKTPPTPKSPPTPITTPPPTKTTPPPSTPKTPPTPTTPPTPIATPPSQDTCPRDTLKLGVCANLLSGLIGVVVGTPSESPCCSLIQGLTDLEAAVCLCTAIKANVLGINLNVDISLSLLLNACSYKVPSGFQCA